jgi:hypothetical protein
MVDYYLPTVPKQLALEILDASGRPIRSFTGEIKSKEREAEEKEAKESGKEPDKVIPKPSMKAGLNRFTWDMTYPGFTEFKDMIMWATENTGPAALPGQYQVRLTVDGKALTQPAEIRIDPRAGNISASDLQKRFALASEIRADVSQANEAILLIRGVRAQIKDRLARTKDAGVIAAAARLQGSIDAVERRIYQVENKSEQDPLNYPIMLNNKLAALGRIVDSSLAAPTDQSYAVHADLKQRLHTELAVLNAALAGELPDLNKQLARVKLPAVVQRPEEAVEPGTADIKGQGAEEEDEGEEEGGR